VFLTTIDTENLANNNFRIGGILFSSFLLVNCAKYHSRLASIVVGGILFVTTVAYLISFLYPKLKYPNNNKILLIIAILLGVSLPVFLVIV
jgi:hypothetical protein